MINKIKQFLYKEYITKIEHLENVINDKEAKIRYYHKRMEELEELNVELNFEIKNKNEMIEEQLIKNESLLSDKLKNEKIIDDLTKLTLQSVILKNGKKETKGIKKSQ